jgi:hypothetical protein
MTATPRRLTMLLGLVMGLSVAFAPAVAAHDSPLDLPERIDLPPGFQPEGIESFGPFLFAGGLNDGAIWRGSAITGEGEILVPGEAGRMATGLHIDRWARLWVAGGPTGTIRVYSILDGRLLRTYTFEGTGFINDLDITRNTVYATDSQNAQLAVVPLRPFGRLPDPSAARLMPLTGQFELQPGFNANGIVARRGWLILVQSNTGLLFRVHPRTGATRQIDTDGYLVNNGDGLELRGRTLYVVRNQDNLVAVLRLSRNLRSARLIGEITAPPGALSVPTTATTTLGALWVVNARFGIPTTEYWITRLPLKP